MDTFGKRLAELRKRRGLTQGQLAERIGMSKSSVASWETNARDPGTDMVSKLASFFEVTSDYLLGRSDDSQRQLTAEDYAEGYTNEWQDQFDEAMSDLQHLVWMLSVGHGPKKHFPETVQKTIEVESEDIRSAHDISFDFTPEDIVLVCKEVPDLDFINEMVQMMQRVQTKHPSVRSDSTTRTKSVSSKITQKEERDIARELERMMENLDSDKALAFDGEPLTDEDRELLRASLEHSLRTARIVAKQRFTPKKYKK